MDEAYALITATGTSFRCEAIEKEIKNVHVDGIAPPLNHQFMHCHMIFDVKMEDFCCNAQLVAGGYMTKAPAPVTYASIVS